MKFKEILEKELERANEIILHVQNKSQYSHAQRESIIKRNLDKRTYINEILKNIDTEVLFVFRSIFAKIERSEKSGYRSLQRIAMYIVNRQKQQSYLEFV